MFLCSVENQSHCDFVKLRNMLIRSHMHDLKDVTCDVHYENYRAQCIQEMTRCVEKKHQRECSVTTLTTAEVTDFSQICLLHLSSSSSPPLLLLLVVLLLVFSKLAQDNRMESPIPILPLSTPDVETEKLIKMKDEEVWINFLHTPYWLILILPDHKNKIKKKLMQNMTLKCKNRYKTRKWRKKEKEKKTCWINNYISVKQKHKYIVKM